MNKHLKAALQKQVVKTALMGISVVVLATLAFRCMAIGDDTTAAPGTVIAMTRDGIDVAAGKGVLRITELQRPGGKRLPVASFLNASRSALRPGTRLSTIE